MKSNPVDEIIRKSRESEAYRNYGADDSVMWGFLATYGQKENIPALKEYVYDLLQIMTQKTAGQRKEDESKGLINVEADLDMTINSIVIEAVALVLSGRLDELEAGDTPRE